MARSGAGIVLLVLIALSACSKGPLLESRNVGPDRSYPVRGTSYYLPKKVLKVQVWSYETSIQRPDPNGGQAGIEEDVTLHFAMHAWDGTDDRIIPDHRHQFVIVPRWDKASDDYIKVGLDKDGLLTSVYGHSTDERSEIASGLADLFSMLVAGPGSRSKWERGARPQPKRAVAASEPQFVAEYQFDPIDPKDCARVTAALSGYGIKMALEKQPDCPTAGSGPGCCQTCDCTEPGIYYRLPIPYRFQLDPAGRFRTPGTYGSEKGEWESYEGSMERIVLMPNEAVCLYAPVSRASFVTSYTSLRFEQGMLLEVETDKPSELLGFVKIPIDAASAILAIPAELLTLRIKRNDQVTDLAAQQKARTDAQRAAIQSQIDLLDAARKMQQGQQGQQDRDQGDI